MSYDAANRLTCFRATPTGPCDRTIHYDVDGQRVLEDGMGNYAFTAFVSPSIRVRGAAATVPATELEVMAFGERVALETSTETIRAAGLFEWVSPPTRRIVLVTSASGCGVLLIVLLARHAAVLVFIARRPSRSAVTVVLVAGQALFNVPPVWAGGGAGGEATRYYELADRLGSGMIVLDDSGERVEHRTFTPFGSEYAVVGTGVVTPVHFGGHLRDEGSGLVYMGARWMDPVSGTFLGIDPLVPSVADPQFHNAYSYVRNNPAMMTDPDGRCPRLHCMVLGAGDAVFTFKDLVGEQEFPELRMTIEGTEKHFFGEESATSTTTTSTPATDATGETVPTNPQKGGDGGNDRTVGAGDGGDGAAGEQASAVDDSEILDLEPFVVEEAVEPGSRGVWEIFAGFGGDNIVGRTLGRFLDAVGDVGWGMVLTVFGASHYVVMSLAYPLVWFIGRLGGVPNLAPDLRGTARPVMRYGIDSMRAGGLRAASGLTGGWLPIPPDPEFQE